MERLALTFAACTLYAICISFGIGRDLDDRVVTRPLIAAGGIALVILGKTWGDWQQASEWFLWFAIAGAPVMIRCAVLHIQAEKQAQLDRYSVRESMEDDIRTRLAH